VTGLLLRLAGPLQSWGERSAFNERDTARYPTRSGLIGMFAAAQGRKRHESISDFSPLTFTVRVDRPGVHLVDFHTVGGGLPRQRTVPTAEGKRRAEGGATIVSRRHYLADAAFSVAVTGPEDLIGTIGDALRTPAWAPYLGRRSCPPDQPLLLRGPVDDPERMLLELPLARPKPRDDSGSVSVDFVYEQPPSDATVPPHGRLELADVPESFHPDRRLYRTRTLYVVPRDMPAELCAGHKYLEELTTYLQESVR
jgi:CRISPR system Cascade subunit CasD